MLLDKSMSKVKNDDNMHDFQLSGRDQEIQTYQYIDNWSNRQIPPSYQN